MSSNLKNKNWWKRYWKFIIALIIYYGSLIGYSALALYAYNKFLSVPTMNEAIHPPNEIIPDGSGLLPLPYIGKFQVNEMMMLLYRLLTPAEKFARDFIYDKPIVQVILAFSPLVARSIYHAIKRKYF